MAGFVSALADNPLYYVGLVLALWAAYAFLNFLWGFVDYVFAMGNEEERMHGRTNMLWGTSWIFVLFVAWEIIRFVASWFQTGVGDVTLGFWLAAVLVPIWILYYLWQLLNAAPKKNGGGH